MGETGGNWPKGRSCRSPKVGSRVLGFGVIREAEKKLEASRAKTKAAGGRVLSGLHGQQGDSMAEPGMAESQGRRPKAAGRREPEAGPDVHLEPKRNGGRSWPGRSQLGLTGRSYEAEKEMESAKTAGESRDGIGSLSRTRNRGGSLRRHRCWIKNWSRRAESWGPWSRPGWNWKARTELGWRQGRIEAVVGARGRRGKPRAADVEKRSQKSRKAWENRAKGLGVAESWGLCLELGQSRDPMGLSLLLDS